MAQHNADNERTKRQYFAFLKEAKRHSEPTVDASAKALNRFEVYTSCQDSSSSLGPAPRWGRVARLFSLEDSQTRSLSEKHRRRQ